DGLPTFDVGGVDGHLAVESSWAQQRRIEDVGPVGGGDHDHTTGPFETVQFDEELVQRLLPLVVASTETGTPVTSHCVDLVDEDDGRAFRLRLLEEVAHSAGAHADEHLDEIGPGDGEEGNPGLAGHGSGEQ